MQAHCMQEKAWPTWVSHSVALHPLKAGTFYLYCSAYYKWNVFLVFNSPVNSLVCIYSVLYVSERQRQCVLSVWEWSGSEVNRDLLTVVCLTVGVEQGEVSVSEHDYKFPCGSPFSKSEFHPNQLSGEGPRAGSSLSNRHPTQTLISVLRMTVEEVLRWSFWPLVVLCWSVSNFLSIMIRYTGYTCIFPSNIDCKLCCLFVKKPPRGIFQASLA